MAHGRSQRDMPGQFTGQPSSFGTVFQQQSLRQEQTQRSLQG